MDSDSPGVSPLVGDGSVLFVDGDSRDFAALEAELGAALPGRPLRFAASAAQALELISERQPDAVVSDLRLHDSDGPRFLAEVQRRAPAIARLIICGEASTGDLVAAAQVAQQVLTKPCDAPTLALAVQRVMAVRKKLDDPRLRNLFGSIDRLPALPEVYQRLVAAASDPNYRVKDIAAIIGSDMATSVELLKLVNSAGFALSRPVVSVEEAVNLLGMRSVSALVLAGSMFRAGALPPGLDADQLQRTAVTASAVARAVGVAEGWSVHDADQVALAAMLRDSGLLVLTQDDPAALSRLDMTLTGPAERAEQEVTAFGCSVASASAYLLGLWGFPQTVVHAVGAQPLVAGEPGSSKFEQILAFAYHRVLAGSGVEVSSPMLDPHRGLRWSTAADSVLAAEEADQESPVAG
jgi:HD-like signal output (HDOD) protein/CheY-like chemotaxis protein